MVLNVPMRLLPLAPSVFAFEVSGRGANNGQTVNIVQSFIDFCQLKARASALYEAYCQLCTEKAAPPGDDGDYVGTFPFVRVRSVSV